MKIYNQKRFIRLPDAFLFDMDNTLYAYDSAHAIAQKTVQNKAINTFSISADKFSKAFKEAKNQIKTRLKYTASSHNRLLYLQRTFELIGLGSQIFFALDFEQTYWRTFLNNAVLFDGVQDLLEDIRLLGIPAAIVTDLTAQIQFRKIIYFGLDKYFDYVVTSEEAGVDKPHVFPFQIALEKMSLKGDCVWMVGDNPLNDIRGAREKINAITLQKIHDGAPLGINEHAPDAAFTDFRKLRKLIVRIGKESK